MQRPTVPTNTLIIQNLPKAQKTLRKRAERFLRGLGICCMTVSSKKQITDTGRLWKEGGPGKYWGYGGEWMSSRYLVYNSQRTNNILYYTNYIKIF